MEDSDIELVLRKKNLDMDQPFGELTASGKPLMAESGHDNRIEEVCFRAE